MKPHRALLLFVVLVLSGCSGDGAAPLATLERGLPSDPETLDPQKARSTQAAEVLRDIGEGLLGYTANGELVPAAAAGWEISEDGLSYTFHLRPEARWSNGDPGSVHFHGEPSILWIEIDRSFPPWIIRECTPLSRDQR